jgi:hypothetical protein
VVRAHLAGGPVANAAAANLEITPLGKKILPLLVQVFTAVFFEPIEVSVAEYLDRDGSMAMAPVIGNGFEMIEKLAPGGGARDQGYLAEVGFGSPGFGHPVAVLFSQFG